MRAQILLLFIASIFILTSCKDKTPEVPEPVINSNMPELGYEVQVNDTLLISPKILYDYDSDYSWEYKHNGEEFSTEKDFELIPNKLDSYEYIFRVKNDRGSDEYFFFAQSIYHTDFEDLKLEKDSIWDAPNNETEFESGEIIFNVSGKPDYIEEWFGFTYSNLTGTKTDVNKTYFSAYNKSTAIGDTIFALLKQDSILSPTNITFKDNKAHKLKSFAVNNSFGTSTAMREGTYVNDTIETSKRFGGTNGDDKDYFILRAVGYKDDIATVNLNIFLADYRSDDNRQNYILREWTTIPLDTLGFVDRIELTLDSSDKTEDGKLRTPATVCIDDIKIIE